jgi:hypothetical protein
MKKSKKIFPQLTGRDNLIILEQESFYPFQGNK